MFSAVGSTFTIDVQSKLESDPNDMTAYTYMQILIQAVNISLFPMQLQIHRLGRSTPKISYTVRSIVVLRQPRNLTLRRISRVSRGAAG